MGEMKDPEMFSELTSEELKVLFAILGSGADAGRGNYGVLSEIWQLRADVHQALADVTHAESAGRRAQAEARACEPELQDETEPW